MTDNADPSVDPNADQNGDGGNSDAGDLKFSQADFDRAIKHRVGEALNKQKQQFADYGDLKAKAERYDELEASQKSELQKAQDRAAELEKQASDAIARAKEASLRSAVVAEAARKNVIDPDAAVALLDRSALEFDDDGTPKGVAEAMESLLTAKPYLVGGNGRSADLGARSGGAAEAQLGREDAKSMTAEEIVAARRAGKFDDALAGKT